MSVRHWARTCLLGAVSAALSGVAIAPAHAGGAWSEEGKAPTLRQRDWRYETAVLQPRATPQLAQAQISRVYWQYDFAPLDPTLNAWLCAASRCVEASSARGMTERLAGLPADTPFKFYFEVPGRGMLPRPMQGQGVQVIVNYK